MLFFRGVSIHTYIIIYQLLPLPHDFFFRSEKALKKNTHNNGAAEVRLKPQTVTLERTTNNSNIKM